MSVAPDRPGLGERLRRLPILWQTLLLVMASLIVAQAMNIAMFVQLPLPRSQVYPMGEIADVLRGRARDPDTRGGIKRSGDGPLGLHLSHRPPTTESARMVSDPGMSKRLADRLDVPVRRVRLFYEADQSATYPFRLKRTDAGVPIRHGEPMFFNTVIAGLEQPDGRWRVVRTPDRPLISPWQLRTMLWFLLSAALVLPLAFLFARQLARPIARFAEAADRVGHDPGAPAVPVGGPAEVRTAAVAVNAMQMRLGEMLAERTGMIGAIAHDLRTPLARIAFRIEGAPEAVRGPVQADVEQMRAMIAATIGFVRGVRVQDQARMDVTALVKRLAGLARDMGGDVVAEGAPAFVMADPLALERLFQNIIDNAVTYAGSAEIRVAQERGRVMVSVSDRGPGLPDAMLDTVFRPFNRGDPSRSRATGGIGLGLAIARSIATEHGGTLVAANRAGGGLVVQAELPAA